MSTWQHLFKRFDVSAQNVKKIIYWFLNSISLLYYGWVTFSISLLTKHKLVKMHSGAKNNFENKSVVFWTKTENTPEVFERTSRVFWTYVENTKP